MTQAELREKFGKEYKEEFFHYIMTGSTGNESYEKNRFKINLSCRGNTTGITEIRFEPVSPADFEITNGFTLIPTGCLKGDC